MKKTNQIITIHLGVLVLYTLFFAIWINYSDAGDDYPNPYKWLGFMFLQAIMMIGHAITIAILASNQPESKPENAKAHWLSLGLILLIGGSICFIAPGLLQ
jgi:hypothetical protein